MIRTLAALALLAAPGAVLAQEADDQARAQQLTRDLNSGPPVAAAPRVAPTPAATPTPTPAPMPAPAAAPAPEAESTSPQPRPRPAPVAAVEASPAETAPAEAPAARAAAPEPSAPAPLDAQARAALPFRLTLPAGVDIVETPSSQAFDAWAVRRGDTTLARIYAGPASQFPIYDGEVRTVQGRSSVIVAEDGARRALEHMFERDGRVPREIHIWVSTLGGGDQALAEAVAQSLDPK